LPVCTQRLHCSITMRCATAHSSGCCLTDRRLSCQSCSMRGSGTASIIGY
jgi:hypothetical protein